MTNGIRQWDVSEESQRRAIFEQEMQKRNYLLPKFKNAIATDSKIFVWKSNGIYPVHQHHRLHAALRRYGPARLLVIEWSHDLSLVGRATEVAPGLVRGYVARFAPYGAADDIAAGGWEKHSA